ncbi:hypothetical protein [Catellatospora paridis]|uniref:hypothetical protein n=1 Tax=Catellatospora paridis TaxID=1617086 RepID=UPI0012D3EDAA|nr:hypothetical protein [Catellatospora paridis]
MTSKYFTRLHRASLTVAALSAALAVWSWLPANSGDETIGLVSFWFVVVIILPGMIVSMRRQSNRNSPLAMGRHVRWFLSGAPRWTVALWALTLAGTLLTMLTGLLPGNPGPAGLARMFAMMAFYFAVTGVLIYRKLAQEQHV